MQRACTHIRLCIQLNLEIIYNFFLFPELQAFSSLNGDKYFASYRCFCVRISFYWSSGVKWIRMWSHRPCNWLRLLTKPTPILSRSICSSHNFVDLSCVNDAQLSVASAVWRDYKLRKKDHDRQEMELSCKSAHKQEQGPNWYWWHYSRVCPCEGYTSRPLLVASLMGSLFYPFLP